MSLIGRVRDGGRKLTDLSDPVYWALIIGLLVTQGHGPVRDSPWQFAFIFLQVVAMKTALTNRVAGLALSACTELVACAYGLAPTIGIGGVVVCAANFRPSEKPSGPIVSLGVLRVDRGRAADMPMRLNAFEGSVPVLLVLAAVATLPWALHFQSGPIFGGPAHAHSPVDSGLLLVFAMGLRANWNFIDGLMRGESKRAEEAEATRDLAVREERARIARELHDVVAHQMSVVVAQAQGARALLERDPTRARSALDTISSTTRDALVELRRLVGVTRAQGAGADPEGPQPGLDFKDLARLASTAEAAGLVVAMHIDLAGAPTIPAGIALSAYRTIQEGLTNASKHAPGAAADVRVDTDGGTLRVEVTNSPPRTRGGDVPGAGVGLIGMRERVAVFGGTLETGPTPNGGWSVVATFPTLEAPPTTSE